MYSGTSNSKIYQKEPRYSKQILPVPLLIIISRFQCMQQRAKRTDASNLIKAYSCERVGEAGVP